MIPNYVIVGAVQGANSRTIGAIQEPPSTPPSGDGFKVITGQGGGRLIIGAPPIPH